MLYRLFNSIFGNNVTLATIFISTLPIIELRGAIPFATNTKIWKSLAMSNWQAFGWSLIGSSLVVPVIALIFIPLINWLKRTKLFSKMACALENRIKNKTQNMAGANEINKSQFKKVIATFIFVAIPLPLTGVWTGTCVALFLGLDFLTTCITVISANFVAGLIITLILQFFPALNDYLLYIFLIIVAIIIICEIIKHFIKKSKTSANNK